MRLSSEMSFCANRNQFGCTGQDHYLELLMRLLPCSSAQFDSAICLRHYFFIRVTVKLSCLLSDKSEYQGSETGLDFSGQN